MAQAPPLADALRFDGRVVLVTGGTKGVGRGIVERFAEAGATVVATARNEPDEPLPGASFRACDVRDAAQVGILLDAVASTHGRLDVVVNNAGGSPMADSASASPRFSTRIVELNLLAPLFVAQAANSIMQDQDDGGSIVNIGSVSGTRPSPMSAAYGAAKAGLANLTRSLAVEWAPKVRVNLIIGGLIATEQAHLHYGDDAGIERVAATVPMQRLATPTDVADACLYLSSPLASYVTGAELAVHGGGERPAFLDAAGLDPPR